MDYVDECNEYAVAAAKLAGKYEFLIAMQEDVRRIFMPDGLEEYLESISEYELQRQLEAEYASYIAMMKEQYEEGQDTRQNDGQS